MKRFYIRKIGELLKEFGMLALLFVPLDKSLSRKEDALLVAGCVMLMLAGIEAERRSE